MKPAGKFKSKYEKQFLENTYPLSFFSKTKNINKSVMCSSFVVGYDFNKSAFHYKQIESPIKIINPGSIKKILSSKESGNEKIVEIADFLKKNLKIINKEGKETDLPRALTKSEFEMIWELVISGLWKDKNVDDLKTGEGGKVNRIELINIAYGYYLRGCKRKNYIYYLIP
jgi:hypothetical protein